LPLFTLVGTYSILYLPLIFESLYLVYGSNY